MWEYKQREEEDIVKHFFITDIGSHHGSGAGFIYDGRVKWCEAEYGGYDHPYG